MFVENFAEMNREAWNEVTPIHQESRIKICGYDLEKEILNADFNRLENEELKMFDMIGLNGKDVVQLCCNNGRELISLKNRGIKKGVGFDISDEAIKEAKKYNCLAASDCEFIRCNVYDIGKEYNSRFDIVYMSIGGMTWLNDSNRLFKLISNLLKPKGHFVIYDMHPFTDMLGCEGEKGYDEKDPNKIVNSYFNEEPWIETCSLDYYGGKQYDAKASICFPRKLSEIFMSIINNGLSIEYFNEFAEDISNGFEEVEKLGKMPLSYSLIAKKRRE